MKVYKTVKGLQTYVKAQKKKRKRIGFVPTLGALHEGHMSLISKAKKTCDIVICSIFVNPTQFNESSDLDKYPRTYESDSNLLIAESCDILFFPSGGQVYPKGLDTRVQINFGKLDKVMEGAFRPGHFDGVAQVVKRLLDIVKPHELFMGQKDFQQVAVVRFMMEHFKLKTKLVVCPIIREKHGLAMSSRNERLPKKMRQDARMINDALIWVKENMNLLPVNELEEEAMDKIRLPKFRPEYFQIIDGFTLMPINHIDRTKYVVACTAVWAGDVRLIDNAILKDIV